MPIFEASFTNVYAYAKATLPSLEGATPKLKCYAICKNENFDKYVGFTVENESDLFDELVGAGEKIGTGAAGEVLAAGGSLEEWCDEPTALNTSTSAGYLTEHSFGILYIDPPDLQSLVGADAPHNLATINALRRAMRNAAKLIEDEESDFPDLAVGDRFWSAEIIADMQQWIIDHCGEFAPPRRITNASSMIKGHVDSADDRYILSIQGEANNLQGGDYTPFEYLCKFIATDLSDVAKVDFGFQYSDTLSPATQLPEVEYSDTGTRVCEKNDYVLTLQLKEIAIALDHLYGVATEFDWTANGALNWVEGGTNDGDDFDNWDDAKNAAEINASGEPFDNSPSQESIGTYIEDVGSSGLSSSSSSSVYVGSESGSSSGGWESSSGSSSSYFWE